MTKKIALIGSAPSSVALAPYDDPSWEIWACSPGARPHLKRVNAFFEIHLWEPDKSWFSPEYVSWLKSLSIPVYMIEKLAEIPASVAYPKEAIMRQFGAPAAWFYTSSLSWMFAMAIAQGAEEIGLWGVDMSAQEEWFFQRSGCHYWIGLAKTLGIKVTIPGQSDLMRPPPLYGFCEADTMHQKLLVRHAELDQRIAALNASIQAQHNELLYLQGARENVLYMSKTFITDPLQSEMMEWMSPILYTSRAVQPEKKPEPAPQPYPAPELAIDVRRAEPAVTVGQPSPVERLINGFEGEKVTWGSTPAPALVDGLVA